jgi:hypothetical protein
VVVQTLRRDARLLTEYDAGHDFTRPGSTAEGEPRPIEDTHAFLLPSALIPMRGKAFCNACSCLSQVLLSILFSPFCWS